MIIVYIKCAIPLCFSFYETAFNSSIFSRKKWNQIHSNIIKNCLWCFRSKSDLFDPVMFTNVHYTIGLHKAWSARVDIRVRVKIFDFNQIMLLYGPGQVFHSNICFTSKANTFQLFCVILSLYRQPQTKLYGYINNQVINIYTGHFEPLMKFFPRISVILIVCLKSLRWWSWGRNLSSWEDIIISWGWN